MSVIHRLIAILLLTIVGAAQANDAHPLAGMQLRTIGPALSSGRISDFAFHPEHPQIYYVATASGGVWKTTDDGISWQHVFRNEGSYATGVVMLDPHNPNTVWIGSGENNAQRSVGYGDGVYKSLDGGATWKNVGLKDSGHIGMIRFHPTERDVVYVAAQGPLWSDGGDRGLYRSTDGGETWERLLEIDEYTGVNEFAILPSNPNEMVASSWQRRRHVWTLINGGPGGGIHKTRDGGATWQKITTGLPGGDLGRIGIAQAPSAPHILYAIIEADDKGKGVYRSTDFGESWEKRSNHVASSPQYYNELVIDPNNPDRVYSLSTFTNVSEDGGKTWSALSIRNKHVDDHALWIDPDNSAHLYLGSDGGIFESWDQGQSWRHVKNLPIVQFYRATPDNDLPFYNVCAGTQDNHTPCGPSRTRYTDGITNADWWIAQFGDGFKPQFDPLEPEIVYAQYQYGGLVRFDRRTGERVSIVPHPGADENADKWNWNAPLIVSAHDGKRLYYASQRVFRSDDRGDSWRAISGDLSRQLDRNELPVMGRVWSVDAIAKNASTSQYGSIIALAESPLDENLLYVGTDDGLIRVTRDGGETWSRVASFRGVPERSLVEDIIASRHDVNTAYAVFDNHKQGDYRPYVYKTTNGGASWSAIAGNLPERGTAHALAEDHVEANLLFVGTEFGAFFTTDGGSQWHELTGLPTIAVRDLEIQRREADLVISTFGLGIYLLEDYTPLRTPTAELSDPTTFAVKDTWLFVPDSRRGWGPKGDYGDDRYAAPNPPFGALLAHYAPDGLETLRDARRSAEKERARNGEDNPYPTWDALRDEDREIEPALTWVIRDADGNLVRRVPAPTGKGFHRTAWDLRYPAPNPVNLSPPSGQAPWISPPTGPMVLPGVYQAQLEQRVRGATTLVGAPQEFIVKPMFEGGLVAADRRDVLGFQNETAALYRDASAANGLLGDIENRLRHLRQAVTDTPAATPEHVDRIDAITTRIQDVRVALNGDRTVTRRAESAPMSIMARLGAIIFAHWDSQSAVTPNHRESLAIAANQFGPVKQAVAAIDADVAALEAELDAIGAPWTPGRALGGL